MNPENSLMASPVVSEAHPETMDFLSSAWCNFAVQALQPELLQDQTYNNMRTVLYEGDPNALAMNMEKCARMDDTDYANSMPSWQSNDLKSWIWMQQAMHPELNYNGYFKKKMFQWKMPFGKMSIKKWVKEIKEKRKEEKRVQRAEVHAALSIAGLAAALAAIAEDTTTKGRLEHEPVASPSREAAMASAAALLASHCAQMAESLGAKRDQLGSVIGSAVSGTSTSDILTLTAAATTSLRGAATLKAREGCKKKLSGTPILPIEVDHTKLDADLDFEKWRSILAKGAQLTIETPDGRCMKRIVSLYLTNEAKVILTLLKRNMFNIITSKKECLVLDQHAELYKDSEGGEFDTCYQIVLTTTRGAVKLDMADDYQHYKMWATTINQMLMLPPITKYELQFCKY
ncbi:hypothetical protein KSS87_021150 [Heliosperma pusillum]|nr:hypothetical protein KSS87_021150 [Heliosperma pusillum]